MSPKRILAFAVPILAIYLAWLWLFCRFYVPPGFMAVVTAKEGSKLPPGQILAQRGQKGVQETVLGEGRHFLNPITFSYSIQPMISIPNGKVGIVTSKVGSDLPAGEFIGGSGQKGIQRGVLSPGSYRLNPYGYQVDIVDAVSIPIGYVGVVTSLSGSQAAPGEFANASEKGIRSDILQPGLYYANPKEFKIDIIEVGLNQVSMQGKEGSAVLTKSQISTGNRAMDALQFKALERQNIQREEAAKESGGNYQVNSFFGSSRAPDDSSARNRKPATAAAEAISSYSAGWSDKKQRDERKDDDRLKDEGVRELQAQNQLAQSRSQAAFVLNQFVGFPSRDGFEISLDMTVEFELEPDRVAIIYRDYGDLPALVDKILMPQVLSISRLKGSAYRAVDFVVGEGREKFQADLTEGLRKSLSDRHITVHNALIRHVNVPDQILSPVQQASIAKEQDLTNIEKQNTAKKQAELNTEQSLIEQRGAEVVQQTAKLKAEIRANQEKLVAEIQADTLKQTAAIGQQTAFLRAERARKIGKAKAEAIQLVEGERANGYVMKTQALGDPTAYSLADFCKTLDPNLKINLIHAGNGTLWTDLQKATAADLFGAKSLSAPPK